MPSVRLFTDCVTLSESPSESLARYGFPFTDLLIFIVHCNRIFEQASPHAVAPGTQADLSDLKIKRASE